MIETITEKAQTNKDYFKIKTKDDPEMLKNMTKNYKVLRRIYNNLYKSVAENFKHYFDNLNEDDLNEIETDMISSGLNSPRNVQIANELLMLFDYFYFINGRFPTTNEHTFVPRAKPPSEVNGQELNLKKLYGKFRGSDSHGIVCSQFLAALFLFFNGGGEEKVHDFLSELYQNMTIIALSADYSFQFEAYTELLTSLNFLFRRLAMPQIEKVKTEDVKTKQQLNDKYEINAPPPSYDAPHVFITDDLQNGSQKIKQVDVVEPNLETPEEIEQNEVQKKSDQEWLDIFLNGVKTTKQVLQELNDQAIADLLSEEVMVPQIDTEIDLLFIDDNDIFPKDDLTDENKKFIKTMLDKSNYDISSDNDDVVPPFLLTEIPGLTPPIETGNQTIDDKNWGDYIKLLETHRPDLLVDEPDNNQIPPIETGNQTINGKNWDEYVKILQTHRPDLLVEEPDNNLIPPTETGNQTIDNKNRDEYVKILETHRPHLIVEERDKCTRRQTEFNM